MEAAGAFVLQICAGLNHLHSKGSFHGGAGGLCVENVFLGRGNVAKIANYYPLCSLVGTMDEKEGESCENEAKRAGTMSLKHRLWGYTPLYC